MTRSVLMRNAFVLASAIIVRAAIMKTPFHVLSRDSMAMTRTSGTRTLPHGSRRVASTKARECAGRAGHGTVIPVAITTAQ